MTWRWADREVGPSFARLAVSRYAAFTEIGCGPPVPSPFG
jgi:hypothetical protein